MVRVMVFLDQALTYDPARRRCDLVFNGRDLTLDATPVTAVLTAVGLDRRAHTDDVVPDTRSTGYAPASLKARRGWCGDALDTTGDLAGTRMWLLGPLKQTEATRLLAEDALQEKLEPLANARNWPMSVLVTWVRANFLGWRVTVNSQPILDLNTPVGV
jgi:phage gp46-like protein